MGRGTEKGEEGERKKSGEGSPKYLPGLSSYHPASDKASDIYFPAHSTPALTTPGGMVYSPPSPGYSPRTPPESEDEDDN